MYFLFPYIQLKQAYFYIDHKLHFILIITFPLPFLTFLENFYNGKYQTYAKWQSNMMNLHVPLYKFDSYQLLPSYSFILTHLLL